MCKRAPIGERLSARARDGRETCARGTRACATTALKCRVMFNGAHNVVQDHLTHPALFTRRCDTAVYLCTRMCTTCRAGLLVV